MAFFAVYIYIHFSLYTNEEYIPFLDLCRFRSHFNASIISVMGNFSIYVILVLTLKRITRLVRDNMVDDCMALKTVEAART